jgi:DNA-directed RNA polymerase subunit M/transcription elongation factor TFIIS
MPYNPYTVYCAECGLATYHKYIKIHENEPVCRKCYQNRRNRTKKRRTLEEKERIRREKKLWSDKNRHDQREAGIPRASECFCFVCGNQADSNHHVDYDKPLEVIPVCAKCHFAWHHANSGVRRASQG